MNKHKTIKEGKALNNEIKPYINEIVTLLAKGETWHKKAANESRKLGVRGLGRFHDCVGINLAMELFELNKILTDIFDYYPHINYNELEKADKYTVSTPAEFKRHFAVWAEFLKEINDKISDILPHIISHVDIYEQMIKIFKQIQNEHFRVKLLWKSFEFGGWNSHDISYKSKIIHKYFEHHYKYGDEINFNIG